MTPHDASERRTIDVIFDKYPVVAELMREMFFLYADITEKKYKNHPEFQRHFTTCLQIQNRACEIIEESIDRPHADKEALMIAAIYYEDTIGDEPDSDAFEARYGRRATDMYYGLDEIDDGDDDGEENDDIPHPAYFIDIYVGALAIARMEAAIATHAARPIPAADRRIVAQHLREDIAALGVPFDQPRFCEKMSETITRFKESFVPPPPKPRAGSFNGPAKKNASAKGAKKPPKKGPDKNQGKNPKK